MLSRLTYRQLKTGVSQAERIAPVIEKLDIIRARIKKVELEIEETKNARSERRAKAKMLDAGIDEADEIIEEVTAIGLDDEDDDE
jgi:predicted transcriptional regulator